MWTWSRSVTRGIPTRSKTPPWPAVVSKTSEGSASLQWKTKFAVTFEGALGLLVVVASGNLRGDQLERGVVRHLEKYCLYHYLRYLTTMSYVDQYYNNICLNHYINYLDHYIWTTVKTTFQTMNSGKRAPGRKVPHCHQVALGRKPQLDLSPWSKHLIQNIW